MGLVADSLRTKLEQALKPTRLEIEDDSARHAGHSGASDRGETHFNVTITSAAFVGVNRVRRQRLVYAAIADELAGLVHALSVTALAPGEDQIDPKPPRRAATVG